MVETRVIIFVAATVDMQHGIRVHCAASQCESEIEVEGLRASRRFCGMLGPLTAQPHGLRLSLMQDIRLHVRSGSRENWLQQDIPPRSRK